MRRIVLWGCVVCSPVHFAKTLKPDWRVASLLELPLHELAERRVRGLLLDLDRTLAPWATTQVPESSQSFVERAKRAGFQPVIVSNSLLKTKHVEKVAQLLGIPYVAGAWKPRRLGLRKALHLLKLSPKECVMIGDQVLTDIWAGRRMGMYTALVQPLGEREFFLTRFFNRTLEQLLQKAWKD